MNPYCKLMYDSVRNVVSVDDKRKLLKKVEAELISIVGVEKPYSLQRCGEEDDDHILSLIELRSKLLDEMFLATPAEMKRFEHQNKRLFALTNKMYHRTAEMYRCWLKADMLPKGEKENRHYEIEGWLEYCFEDETSIITMEEDEYYGSDFLYMHNLIDDYQRNRYHRGRSEIASCSADVDSSKLPDMADEELGFVNELDDGQSWAEGSLHNPAFDKYCICYALHAICTHAPYSIADMLRMDEFWVQTDMKWDCIDNPKCESIEVLKD